MRRTFSLARDKAGSSRPARMAMMAITTSSSISVKAREAAPLPSGGTVVPAGQSVNCGFEKGGLIARGANGALRRAQVNSGVSAAGTPEKRFRSVRVPPRLPAV